MPADELPHLRDWLPAPRSRRAGSAFEAIAIAREEAQLEHLREVWRLDEEERALKVQERRWGFRHQQQMDVQAELRGTLKLFRSVVFTAVVVLALGELATGGSLGIELLRLVRAPVDWVAGCLSQP